MIGTLSRSSRYFSPSSSFLNPAYSPVCTCFLLLLCKVLPLAVLASASTVPPTPSVPPHTAPLLAQTSPCPVQPGSCAEAAAASHTPLKIRLKFYAEDSENIVPMSLQTKPGRGLIPQRGGGSHQELHSRGRNCHTKPKPTLNSDPFRKSEFWALAYSSPHPTPSSPP
ncbi:Hypothetical predicted protein [Podarcis lilfordi]|uniref:Uncharacterized protein n=1 Tax=Podarcis lilfordi TaxID=74358 RepID=A0AA35LF56_9SAUR|nr:Hypothetical predicted protein [Podarcis lilfordi]